MLSKNCFVNRNRIPPELPGIELLAVRSVAVSSDVFMDGKQGTAHEQCPAFIVAVSQLRQAELLLGRRRANSSRTGELVPEVGNAIREDEIGPPRSLVS
jgi:hypothetical protein